MLPAPAFETNLRRERQMEGIARAKANGIYFGKGRPASIDAPRVREFKSVSIGCWREGSAWWGRPGGPMKKLYWQWAASHCLSARNRVKYAMGDQHVISPERGINVKCDEGQIKEHTLH